MGQGRRRHGLPPEHGIPCGGCCPRDVSATPKNGGSACAISSIEKGLLGVSIGGGWLSSFEAGSLKIGDVVRVTSTEPLGETVAVPNTRDDLAELRARGV